MHILILSVESGYVPRSCLLRLQAYLAGLVPLLHLHFECRRALFYCMDDGWNKMQERIMQLSSLDQIAILNFEWCQKTTFHSSTLMRVVYKIDQCCASLTQYRAPVFGLMHQHSFAVGDRVQIDRNTASVRYVGSIDGQDGIWVGLEWDDESRGKHDGSHSGRR